MKEDNEMLDSAIDEALNELDERSKSSEQETSTKEVEAHDEPVGDESPDEPKEAQEEDLDQEANVENNQGDGEAEPQTATPPADAPTFWSAEEKAAFAKADPALKEIIKRRELAAQQHISRLTNEAKSGKGFEQRLNADLQSPEAIQMHRAKLAAQGIKDEVEELHRYRAWDRVLTSDPHAVISDLMRKNGFTPYDFANEANYEPENQYQDPRVDEAIKRAEAAEKAIEEYKEQQNQARFAEVVNTYKAGKFEDGEPRERFLAIYAPQIDSAFSTLRKHPNYQHLTEVEALDHATKYVRSQISQLHGIKFGAQSAPQKTREQIIQESKKAQAAASATTGAPNTASLSASKKPRLKGKTDGERVESAIDVALDRAYGMQ